MFVYVSWSGPTQGAVVMGPLHQGLGWTYCQSQIPGGQYTITVQYQFENGDYGCTKNVVYTVPSGVTSGISGGYEQAASSPAPLIAIPDPSPGSPCVLKGTPPRPQVTVYR
jgi:hypothetical protein